MYEYFTAATEGLLKFAKDTTASTEERNKYVDMCLKAIEVQINNLTIKDIAREIVVEVAQTKARKFAGEQLQEHVVNMLPDILKADMVADIADLVTTENTCEKIEKQYREFVTQVTQSSSKVN